ncbi:MAG: NAD(P)H-hydrate dehydratase, partial [Acidobacteriales bacterium]|nr:NAD(P)H-hydrate dehydratase [Terriglobales bacterium]
MLVGPGLGTEKATREFLGSMLKHAQEPAAVKGKRRIGFQTGPDEQPNDAAAAVALPPLVIDADGLNLLAETESWWTLLPENTILTPHPGEMARLAKLETADVQKNRWQLARDKAQEWRVVLVLKGAHTLVAAPDGQFAVLPFKTDALATAGTGDILAGLIVGLLAQGMKPYDAAIAGAYVHGQAGKITASRSSSRSIIAGDIMLALGDAFAEIDH